MIELFQRVALTRDLNDHRLCAGDIACVIDRVPHPDEGEPGCVLEVFSAIGESIAVLTVPESFAEPLAADQVLSARPMTRRPLEGPGTALDPDVRLPRR